MTDQIARGVLDTSALIHIEKIDPTSLPVESVITTITLAELSVGPHLATTERERAVRQAHVQQAEADFEPLPFDASAARIFGVAAAELRSAGRTVQARGFDVLIGSIALSRELPVFTANPQDFHGLTGLDVYEVTPLDGSA